MSHGTANNQSYQAGVNVEDIFREMYIENGAFYNWRNKYAGLEVNEVKRLKEFESDNVKLKKLLAEKMFEVETLSDVVSKKW